MEIVKQLDTFEEGRLCSCVAAVRKVDRAKLARSSPTRSVIGVLRGGSRRKAGGRKRNRDY